MDLLFVVHVVGGQEALGFLVQQVRHVADSLGLDDGQGCSGDAGGGHQQDWSGAVQGEALAVAEDLP